MVGRKRENSIKRSENWIASGAENITGYHYSFRLRARIPLHLCMNRPRSRISNLMGVFHVSGYQEPILTRTTLARDSIEYAPKTLRASSLVGQPIPSMIFCLFYLFVKDKVCEAVGSGIFIFNSLNMARFSRFWFKQNASKFLHVMDHLGGELKGPSNSSPCAFSRKQELEGKKGLAVWQLE